MGGSRGARWASPIGTRRESIHGGSKATSMSPTVPMGLAHRTPDPSPALPSRKHRGRKHLRVKYLCGKYRSGKYRSGQHPCGKHPCGECPCGEHPRGKRRCRKHPCGKHLGGKYPCGKHLCRRGFSPDPSNPGRGTSILVGGASAPTPKTPGGALHPLWEGLQPRRFTPSVPRPLPHAQTPATGAWSCVPAPAQVSHPSPRGNTHAASARARPPISGH